MKTIYIVLAFILILAGAGGLIWYINRQASTKAPVVRLDKIQQTSAATSSVADLKDARKAFAAGSFYPADKDALTKMVDTMLAQASSTSATGTVRVLVVPHAGYEFSGPVAAAAYKTIQGKPFDRVILLGVSHKTLFKGVAVDKHPAWETPLGQVPVDMDFVNGLLSALPDVVKEDAALHADEHALEVQLPFLQRTLGTFKIVPILLSANDTSTWQVVGNALSVFGNSRTLVIASSDLSHYPSSTDAERADKQMVDAILSGNPQAVDQAAGKAWEEKIPNLETPACAIPAIRTAMLYASLTGADKPGFIAYANSGEKAGGKDKVVGYASVEFTEPDPMPLTKRDLRGLADIARASVEFALTGKASVTSTQRISGHNGIFVTINKKKELRGCVGGFGSNLSLTENTWRTARMAAEQDKRFTPIKAEELPDLTFQVSVLSPLERVTDWQQIKLGTQGVQLCVQDKCGVFLPEVAKDMGGDLKKFMSELCTQKAGLPADCYLDSKAEIYAFTTQVSD